MNLATKFRLKRFANVKGIGTDLVHVQRFRKLLDKYPTSGNKSTLNKIIAKFMHPYEIDRLEALIQTETSQEPIIRYVAGVWATKEAIFKSLRCNSFPASEFPPAQFIFTKICYKTNEVDGRPKIGIDCSQLGVWKQFSEHLITNSKFLVSLSHDADYLISFVCHIKDEIME
ncbi:LAMI_0F04632g1_1 [Lachancea mirantina]|uniref:LAMI_0F04632g1_1 n=1 Tax=Lachancea mirantina TaxID=1230905 RepID=A0A1G4JXW9_9SACH|nr:LAMI_0F04632g1_1 [Lachancea mirantina]